MARRRALPINLLPSEPRTVLAQQVARWMVEMRCADYGLARSRVLRGLGLRLEQQPTPLEIEAALAEYLQWHQPQQHAERLAQMHHAAAELMRWLEPFQPLLSGSLVRGVAPPDAAVTIQLCGESLEAVWLLLQERGVPLEQDEVELLEANQQRLRVPRLRFMAGVVLLEILLLPPRCRHHPPLCPVEQRPVKRLTRAALLQRLPTPMRP